MSQLCTLRPNPSAVFVAAALLLTGCSSESGSDSNVGTDAGQGGRDVGTIDGSESEVGEDAAADVVPDTVDAVDGETSDVAPDAAPDVAPDAQADSGPLDGGTDTTDAGLDAATGLPIGDPCDESSECEGRRRARHLSAQHLLLRQRW